MSVREKFRAALVADPGLTERVQDMRAALLDAAHALLDEAGLVLAREGTSDRYRRLKAASLAAFEASKLGAPPA